MNATNGRNVSSNDLLNPFYSFLSSSGFVPLLVILITVRTLIASVGILLNLLLVFVTISNRNLHGSTNVLIAIDSLSLAIYQFGFFPMFFIVLTGQNLIRLDQCFWPMLLPVFAKNVSSALMVAIGLDRLKFVIFPRISSHLQKYFAVLWLILSALFGISIIFISYRIMRQIPQNLVMCAASEVTQQEAAFVSFYSTLILNCVSPAVYCVLAICLYVRRPKNNNTQSLSLSQLSLFRSIFVLMLLQLLGWTSNSLSLLFFQNLFAITSLSDLTKWAINCAFSYILIIATATNGPILYFCSFEYKNAIQKQFRGFCRSIGNISRSKNSRVVVIKIEQRKVGPMNGPKNTVRSDQS
ncbi:hypothetical protein niasHT_025324 [Heterodera trifolii]|uniref:G-protein coupled receptors family 1 profile domain-containing protein n=1 Tax=Heterodera trifolii TaxID=157864 RepID=A0ABD2KKI9_9BILA